MKNYKIVSVLALFLFMTMNCKKDEKPTVVPDITGTHIEVEDLKAYLPNKLLTEASLVYKNSSGEEKLLTTTFSERDFKAKAEGKEYSYNQFFIRFSNEEDPRFSIELHGYGLYTSKFDVQKVISASLMPLNSTGSSLVSCQFENGKTNC